MNAAASPTVLISTYLEPELVDWLRQQHPEIEFVFPQGLLAPGDYPGDHRLPVIQDPAALEQWGELLRAADILFDFGPKEFHAQLAALPRLRWIQATSAGVGQLARRIGLTAAEAPVVTTASGVHAKALAEFALMSLIYFSRDLDQIQADQRSRRWSRRCGRLVDGQLVAVVGAGSVGREAARMVRCLGAETVGVVRDPRGRTADSLGVDRLIGVDGLDGVLAELDALILAMPHTDSTDRMIDASRIARLPARAVVINLARGAVIDEPALTAALRDGRLRGAALDVFATEPLPQESELWGLANVLVTPHSMSTVLGENRAILEIFSENLQRFQTGQPLLNQLDRQQLY